MPSSFPEDIRNGDFTFIGTFEKLDMPYNNMKWEKFLGLDDSKLNLLIDDLGNNIFNIDKNLLFKEYWLWFIKHLKKRN